MFTRAGPSASVTLGSSVHSPVTSGSGVTSLLSHSLGAPLLTPIGTAERVEKGWRRSGSRHHPSFVHRSSRRTAAPYATRVTGRLAAPFGLRRDGIESDEWRNRPPGGPDTKSERYRRPYSDQRLRLPRFITVFRSRSSTYR